MAKDTNSDAGTQKALGVRARVRAELTSEIKAAARRQLAADGAAALSLRAIARELEMASSAIYRYFASREDLLTALIVDAYNAVGAAVESADESCERHDYGQRLTAMARAIREWAIENPHEYALIYGSPVPGYEAPEDTIDPAVRVPFALISVIVDRYASEVVTSDKSSQSVARAVIDLPRSGQGSDATPESLAASLAQLSEYVDHTVGHEALAQAVQAWAEIFGLISLELFGHFHNAVTNTAAFFEHSMQALVERTLA